MRYLPTIALLVVTLVPEMSAQEKPAPTLKETEDWITNTLERGDGGIGYGHFLKDFPNETDNSNSDVRVSFNSCEMNITTHTQQDAVCFYSDLVETVNLKDPDPIAIEVSPLASRYHGQFFKAASAEALCNGILSCIAFVAFAVSTACFLIKMKVMTPTITSKSVGRFWAETN